MPYRRRSLQSGIFLLSSFNTSLSQVCIWKESAARSLTCTGPGGDIIKKGGTITVEEFIDFRNFTGNLEIEQACQSVSLAASGRALRLSIDDPNTAKNESADCHVRNAK